MTVAHGLDLKRRTLAIPRSRPRHYLSLPGSIGNVAAATDSALLSVTADIDIRVRVALTDWTPTARKVIVSKWTAAGSQQSYELNIETNGTVRFIFSPDGSTVGGAASSVAPSVVDGADLALRVTRVKATGTVTYFTSGDDVNWTQLGTTVATSVNAGIFDSTTPVYLGQRADDTLQFAGRIYYVQIRSGVDGPIVANADFRHVSPGTDPVVDSVGNSWDLIGTAAVAA